MGAKAPPHIPRLESHLKALLAEPQVQGTLRWAGKVTCTCSSHMAWSPSFMQLSYTDREGLLMMLEKKVRQAVAPGIKVTILYDCDHPRWYKISYWLYSSSS